MKIVPAVLCTLALAGCLGPMGEVEDDPDAVRVVATEWDLELSRATFPVDEPVTFEFHNEGEVSHDFGGDWGRMGPVGPGEQARLVVTFDESGEHAYWCSVAGHRDAGMEGTVRIA